MGVDGAGYVPEPTAVDPGTRYDLVRAGWHHTCGIRRGGALNCWGLDHTHDGRSADGLTRAPTVVDPNVAYIDVAPGEHHTCAVTRAGVLKCWGVNPGIPDARPAAEVTQPTILDPGTRYVAVAAGRDDTCGITRSGALKCWSTDDPGGAIGVPQPMDPGEAYARVAVGADHACGITRKHWLKCWKTKEPGVPEEGGVRESRRPAAVGSGTRWVNVALINGGTFGIFEGALRYDPAEARVVPPVPRPDDTSPGPWFGPEPHNLWLVPRGEFER